MVTALKNAVLVAAVMGLSTTSGGVRAERYEIYEYSQKTLLKNWALSVCLAGVAKDEWHREDANASASAYLEFGRQPIEAYEELRDLASKYEARIYSHSSSVKSELNTMKCIDLFHSKELNALATQWVKKYP
ncbi:MAG: T6SS amidase immunity protein Tai4 family protein [Rhodocyclaceae bacterium]